MCNIHMKIKHKDNDLCVMTNESFLVFNNN